MKKTVTRQNKLTNKAKRITAAIELDTDNHHLGAIEKVVYKRLNDFLTGNSDNAYFLHQIARLSVLALTKCADERPEAVRKIAENETDWPVFRSFAKNDRAAFDLVSRIGLGRACVNPNTKSNLHSKATKMQASEIAVKMIREAVAEWRDKKNFRDLFPKRMQGSLRTTIRPNIPENRPTKENFKEWRKKYFKPYFDKKIWPLNQQNIHLVNLETVAKKQCLGSGNAEQYLNDYGLKKYLRDHVMQALKLLLPLR